MPAECDVAIRPGWFYHPEQQGKTKTSEQLFQLYLKSVGRGGSLDLGISPNTKGLLDEEDIASLKGLGQLVENTFKKNLAKTAVLKASNVRGKAFGPDKLVDTDRYSYWSTADEITTPDLTLTWKEDISFDIIRLRENIKLGQRIGAVEVDAMVDGAWTTVGHATSIGSCRIISIPSTIKTKQVRLRVTSSPVCIALSEFGLYNKAKLETSK
jgi:alpha-L-fucosidase